MNYKQLLSFSTIPLLYAQCWVYSKSIIIENLSTKPYNSRKKTINNIIMSIIYIMT